MNKIKNLIVGVFVIGILVVNVSLISKNTQTNKSSFTLKNITSFAQADPVEEVTVTCDSGGSGICYDGENGAEVECPDGSCGNEINCFATGITTDCCDGGDTCD